MSASTITFVAVGVGSVLGIVGLWIYGSRPLKNTIDAKRFK